MASPAAMVAVGINLMKSTKHISILVGILLFTFIAYTIYFVGGISSTYPPLKEYYFNKDMDRFGLQLMELNNLNSIKLQIEDTVGDYPVNHMIHFKILLNDNFDFNLRYHRDKAIVNEERIVMDLIGVFDRTKMSGGYRITDSEDILSLIDKFEKEILKNIKN